MAGVCDAKPGDIYVDKAGKLWRVLWTCAEPTVGVEAVEPWGYSSPPPDSIDITTMLPPNGTFLREHRQGGVNGLMWQDFTKVWSKP
jgi:hypothetical protein